MQTIDPLAKTKPGPHIGQNPHHNAKKYLLQDQTKAAQREYEISKHSRHHRAKAPGETIGLALARPTLCSTEHQRRNTSPPPPPNGPINVSDNPHRPTIHLVLRFGNLADKPEVVPKRLRGRQVQRLRLLAPQNQGRFRHRLLLAVAFAV